MHPLLFSQTVPIQSHWVHYPKPLGTNSSSEDSKKQQSHVDVTAGCVKLNRLLLIGEDPQVLKIGFWKTYSLTLPEKGDQRPNSPFPQKCQERSQSLSST